MHKQEYRITTHIIQLRKIMNMKNNILKSLFIALTLVLGVNNAWAVDHTGGYVYFLKPSTWTGSKVMMFIGHKDRKSVV